ncbi:MAG TPA: carboxypeptidase regulatory-like domain-containing protein [Thermoplasmatales archaeon]|nr:carboxypeptidase regulatory-like domain-containing protein [Thermoplasmatales archaeon]
MTNATGRYSFRSLIPGDYQINVTKLPGYFGVENVTIESNKTKLVNVSIDYIPVNVSGQTIDQEDMIPIYNVSIAFAPDRSIANNTARFSSARSDETGYYSVLLRPGTYNVSVSQPVNVSGQIVTYTYSGHLIVNVGEGVKTFDILLAREE